MTAEGFTLGKPATSIVDAQHNNPDGSSSAYTLKNGPWDSVWSETYPDRGSAMRRERQIKAMKSARWIREELLNEQVPARRD